MFILNYIYINIHMRMRIFKRFQLHLRKVSLYKHTFIHVHMYACIYGPFHWPIMHLIEKMRVQSK